MVFSIKIEVERSQKALLSAWCSKLRLTTGGRDDLVVKSVPLKYFIKKELGGMDLFSAIGGRAFQMTLNHSYDGP
ncbi:hypothetical protein TNCV_5104931 [Trichonephila clavipes]|nr:hypothetical protein TNCV_5104931 [Trichonephila clavipes]